MNHESTEARLADLEERVLAALRFYQPTFDALLIATDLKPSEKKDLELLNVIRRDGLAKTYSRRKSTQDELLRLLEDFCAFGPSAVLRVGSQRGGDFLLNQLRGQWAEKVCCSIEWPGNKILPFGPSGAAMPGASDHKKVVRTYREITLTEGKRPDLIAFSESVWDRTSAAQRQNIECWPDRLVTEPERELVSASRCGIEVKNSAWHYGERRKTNPSPLAVTVKDEELESLVNWTSRYGVPVLFMQVLFDEVYCMSFARMRDAIERRALYKDGDYKAGMDRETQKHTHSFFLHGDTHLCAKTVFPSESKAILTVLPGGSVIPHIRFLPIGTTDSRPDVIEKELAYRSGR